MLFKKNKYFALVIIVTFLFGMLGNKPKAYAKWQDKSDEVWDQLDGGGSSAGPIIAVAVVGIAAVGLLYYFKVKKNKKIETGKEVEQPTEESEVDSFDSSYLKRVSESKLKSTSLEKNIIHKKHKLSIKPFFDLRNNSYSGLKQNELSGNFKDKSVIVGLSANF